MREEDDKKRILYMFYTETGWTELAESSEMKRTSLYKQHALKVVGVRNCL